MKNHLKVERAKTGISQAELAKFVGVSRQTINSIEKGRYIPSTDLALRLSRHFKCRVEDIFQLED